MDRDLTRAAGVNQVSCQGCDQLELTRRGRQKCPHVVCPKGRTEPEPEYQRSIIGRGRR